MPIRITIKSSLAEVQRKLGQLRAQQDHDAMQQIDIAMLEVLRDSKTKPPRVPVDTGALQSTGFTEPSKLDGTKIVATIGYGGVATTGEYVDYAVYVHDNLNGRIQNYKRPGSGPKFLEAHLNNKQRRLKDRIEFALGRAWSKI